MLNATLPLRRIGQPEDVAGAILLLATQEARYLENFWQQFGNSVFIGLLTMVLTVLIASLASFAVSRMRLSKGSLLTNAALLLVWRLAASRLLGRRIE